MATTTQGTQDEETKQKYNTICDGHHNMQTKQESGNIGYKRWTQTKHKHNIMRVGHHNMQTKTNKVNKTWVLLQTTGGKDESNIVSSKEIVHSYHMIPRNTLHIL